MRDRRVFKTGLEASAGRRGAVRVPPRPPSALLLLVPRSAAAECVHRPFFSIDVRPGGAGVPFLGVLLQTPSRIIHIRSFMLNSLSFPSCHSLSLFLSLYVGAPGEKRRDIEWFIDVSRGCLYSGRRLNGFRSLFDSRARPPPPRRSDSFGRGSFPFLRFLSRSDLAVSIAGDLDARPSAVSMTRGSGVAWTRRNLFRSCRLDVALSACVFRHFPPA